MNKEEQIINPNIPNQKEAERLLDLLDTFEGRLSEWERYFVIDMIERWKGKSFSIKQRETIQIIADRHKIL